LNQHRLQRLELLPSAFLAGTVLAVHATAAACFLATLSGFSGPALAALVLGLGATAAWQRALLRGSRSACAVEIEPSGTAVVKLRSGEAIPVRAVRGIGVTRHWVALRPAAGAGRAVLVTAGMLGPAEMRILRLWALWGRIPGLAWRAA
jgi:hypothetical protein